MTSSYTVCPACGGDRDWPRFLRPTSVWGAQFLCMHPFHRGEGAGYELQSEAERERLDERRAAT